MDQEDGEPKISRIEMPNMDQTPSIFPCISCERTFLNREQCREHMREHAKSRTLRCRYCNELQSNMKQLLNHLKSHREESLAFRGATTQLAKTKNAMKDKQIPMTVMTSDIKTLDTVIDSSDKIRPPSAGRGRKKGSYVYSRTCAECGEVFQSMTTFKNHRKLHNAGKLLYSCSYCNYRSDFPAAIEKHLKKKHEDMKKLYKCALCEYVAIRISLLKTHVALNQHSTKT